MNTQIETRPVTGELGPKQQEAVAGPADQIGPEMSTYVCSSCNQQYPDIGLYFYDVGSVKCIWCTKFPKAKNVRTIKTA